MTLDLIVPANDLGDPQRRAADPSLSAFVTANAGSGKTKTLIDRVARLLLEGAKPETVLCVTYTKAAASEMQRRLFQRLGDWSVMADDDLRRQLALLQGVSEETFVAGELSAARALFARALETPGGLKIQTIHAFCEKLLKRFPLEAGVSPGFKVMDDRDAAEIAYEARETMAGGPAVFSERRTRVPDPPLPSARRTPGAKGTVQTRGEPSAGSVCGAPICLSFK